MNHQDIVARIKASEPADAFTTADGILRFLLQVLAALPHEERGGLLRKDAGENIAFYPPSNCNVSISRVCYPDGQLWKILTDSGPGGANGPAWNDDGTVEASRYIDIGGAGVPPPVDPPAPPAPTVDLDALAAKVTALYAALEARVTAIEQRPVPPPQDLPPLVAVGKIHIFGFDYNVRFPVQKA